MQSERSNEANGIRWQRIMANLSMTYSVPNAVSEYECRGGSAPRRRGTKLAGGQASIVDICYFSSTLLQFQQTCCKLKGFRGTN